MKIAALVANLSKNPVARTYPIVKVLQRRHEVQVIGVTPSGEVYTPYRDALDYTTIMPVAGPFGVERTVMQVVHKIDADMVYAFKPMLWSFGAALACNLSRRIPVVLDIEDWDNWRFAVRNPLWKFASPLLKAFPARKRNLWYDWVVDALHNRACQKTVSSNFLQARYGGVKLAHGPDTSHFDPARFDRPAIRCELGFDGRRVALFAGMVKAHKGVAALCRVVRARREQDCVLAVCGVRTPELDSLLAEYPDCITYLGQQPHDRMPAVWLAADVVVLPQRDTLFAGAQLPAKVFEAMAMERPIIASAVSDLPEILAGCGWVVPPENDEALAATLQHVLEHESDARQMGALARQRCIERYSWDAMETILAEVFEPMNTVTPVGHRSAA